jgi:hypothetical protein
LPDLLLNRRIVLAGAASAAGSIWGSAWAQPSAEERSTLRCADFLDAVGVNIHLPYVRTAYNDTARVLAAMRHVGLRYARDAAPYSLRPNADHYAKLAAAGVSFCVVWGPKRPMDNAIAEIGALEAAHPGAVHALEGPNEIKRDYAYADLTGIPAAQKFMTDLRVAVSADRRLHGKPLVSFTSYAAAPCDCDFANWHPYPKAGAQPGPLIRKRHDECVGPDGVMPGKPMMFTEFGYHTLVGRPTRPGAWPGVDETSQAILILIGLFEAAAVGLRRTYIYELLDQLPDEPGSPNQERHFGLFHVDGSPKLAAESLRTLFHLLSDPGPRSSKSSPTGPPIAVVAPPSAGSLQLESAAGRRFVLLWNRSPVWDKDAMAAAAPSPVSVLVNLARPARVGVVDLIDSRLNAEHPPGNSVNIQLASHPVALDVG